MDTTLSIIAVICGIVGLLGAILPVLPGTLLSYAGLLCLYFTSDSDISVTMLVLWGVVSAIVIVMDYFLPGYFSKKFGGTKAGSIGAMVGVLIGVFLGPIGIILGPFAGAVIGELIANKLTFRRRFRWALALCSRSLWAHSSNLLPEDLCCFTLLKIYFSYALHTIFTTCTHRPCGVQ